MKTSPRSQRPSTDPSASVVGPESGVVGGVTWAREIPRGSPFLWRYERLPLREYEAIRRWGSTFYSFQRPWVFDDSRFALTCKGRQIGISHATAGSICLWSVFGGETTTIVSDKEKSALETLAKVKDHARFLRRAGSEVARTVTSNTEEIVFASGGRVVAFTSKGSRSFTGNLILDEFAYHSNPDEVWEASAPNLTTGRLRMRVISTPNGIGNRFHVQTQLARDPKSGWSYYELPMTVAIASGYPVDLAACRMLANNDERLFAQMYECSFLDNVLQYIPHEKIEAAKTTEILHRDGPGLFYAGLDIGETSDRTVLTVVRVYQGVIYPVHVEAIGRTEWDAMDAMVAWAFRTYRLRRLCVDKTGLGTFPAQKMQQRHGDRVEVSYRRNKVEMIQFTAGNKELLATQLFSNVSDRTLRLPAGDAQLPTFSRRNRKGSLAEGVEIGEPIVVNAPARTIITDSRTTKPFVGTATLLSREVAAIQRVVTPHGNVSYVSPRTQDGHGDHAWSLALACHAVDAVHPIVAALQARMGRSEESTDA